MHTHGDEMGKRHLIKQKQTHRQMWVIIQEEKLNQCTDSWFCTYIQKKSTGRMEAINWQELKMKGRDEGMMKRLYEDSKQI